MGLLLAAIASMALAQPAWPLQSSTNAGYLTDQVGRPFLVTADSAWCLINSLTDEEIDTYLTARRAQGFNAVQIMLMAQHSGCGGGGGSVDRYGQTPFITGDADWSVPNEAYWSRVDRILEKLRAHGMLALATPAYLGFSCYYGTQGWCGIMADQPVERMTAFGRFIGRRYRSQGNIIWIAGGDADPLQYPGIDERVDALMSAVREGDGGRHLITGHAGRGVTAFESFGAHSWLTVNSAYDGESCPDDSMDAQIKAARLETPGLPVYSIEQLYDAEGADARCLADQYFWAVLDGCVGHTFGNRYIWAFLPGWDSDLGIDSPGSRVQANAARLMRSRRYWLFAPDDTHGVVTAGYGAGSATVTTARALTGETVMAYVPDGGTVITVDMRRLNGTRATAYWFSPVTGVATLIGTFSTRDPMDFTSPSDANVLVLDDAARALGVPGARDVPTQAHPGSRGARMIDRFFTRE